jgi:hypothetical protein
MRQNNQGIFKEQDEYHREEAFVSKFLFKETYFSVTSRQSNTTPVLINCLSSTPNAVKFYTVHRHGLAVQETKLRGMSPRANYTDRETAACRRS